MNYETIYQDFIDLFPDDQKYFEELQKENDVDTDTMYLLFGMVVCPFLHKIVEESDEKAKKAFQFIENMELSNDDEIANLADVGILEVILTDENGGINKFKNYLGEKTMKSVKHLSNFFDIYK